MGIIKEVCLCGHAKETHLREDSGYRCGCLAMHCDCRHYRDHLQARTPLVPSGKTRRFAAGATVRVIDENDYYYCAEGKVDRILNDDDSIGLVDFGELGFCWMSESQVEVL